ncbi:unnamed protein product [Diplocarpon coronariae]
MTRNGTPTDRHKMSGLSKALGICIPNTEQFDLESVAGFMYRIYVSWPLCWTRKTPDKTKPVKILYVTDGNAQFFSAMETVRRHSISSFNKSAAETIVVGIGYPLDVPEQLYDGRRNRDLTPKPSTIPLSEASLWQSSEGGADEFLDFIQTRLKPFIKSQVFSDLDVGHEVLFGHSYGGLFALHALFTRPEMFNTYIAASPSIWYHNQSIKHEEATFLANGGAKDRTLRMFYGSLEQHPISHPRESEEEFEKRKRDWENFAMGKNTEEMFARLQESGGLENVELRVYPGEDHRSVVGCCVEGMTASIFRDGLGRPVRGPSASGIRRGPSRERGIEASCAFSRAAARRRCFRSPALPRAPTRARWAGKRVPRTAAFGRVGLRVARDESTAIGPAPCGGEIPGRAAGSEE